MFGDNLYLLLYYLYITATVAIRLVRLVVLDEVFCFHCDNKTEKI